MIKGPIYAAIFIVGGIVMLVWSIKIYKKLKLESRYIAWRGFLAGTASIILGLMILHDYLTGE